MTTIQIIAIVIIALTIVLFCINKIPAALVSLFSILMMVLFGVLDIKTAFAGFSSNTILLVAGMMIIGYALIENGIADIIAKFVFDKLNKKPMILMIAIFLSSALLSAFLQNMAVLVVYFALIDAYCRKNKDGLKRKGLYMVAMIGCLLGGNSTLAGSSPPGVANSILESLGGESFGFFEPAIVGLPLTIIMCFLFWLFFYKLGNKIFYKKDENNDVIEEENNDISINKEIVKPVKWKMWLTASIAIATTVCFLLFPKISSSVIALTAVCVLLFTGCINEKKTLKNLDWSILILVASTTGIAAGFTVTGLGDKIVNSLTTVLGENSENMVIWVFIFVFLSGIITNFISNSSAIAIFSTLAASVATTLGISAVPLVMAVLWGGCTGMSLPIASATVSMTMKSGLKVKDYLIFGTLLSITIWIISALLIIFAYGLL